MITAAWLGKRVKLATGPEPRWRVGSRAARRRLSASQRGTHRYTLCPRVAANPGDAIFAMTRWDGHMTGTGYGRWTDWFFQCELGREAEVNAASQTQNQSRCAVVWQLCRAPAGA